MTVMLIGNKGDLDTRRQVSTEEGERFAKEHDLVFLETSAKTSYNVEEAFLRTSKVIFENIDKGIYDLSNDKSGIRVGNESYSIQGSTTRLDPSKDKKKGEGGGGMCC